MPVVSGEQEEGVRRLKDNVIVSKKFEPCILWQIGYNKGTSCLN